MKIIRKKIIKKDQGIMPLKDVPGGEVFIYPPNDNGYVYLKSRIPDSSDQQSCCVGLDNGFIFENTDEDKLVKRVSAELYLSCMNN